MSSKRSLIPTVMSLETRLSLSTTTPTIVQPPTVTGVITTLQPTVTPIKSTVLSEGGTMDHLATVQAPILVTMPSGTGQTVHFLTVVVASPRDIDPLYQKTILSTPTVAAPVSSLS